MHEAWLTFDRMVKVCKSKGIFRQNLDLEVAVSSPHLLLHVDPLQVVGVEGEPGLGGGRGEARVGAGVPLQRGPLGVPGAATVLDTGASTTHTQYLIQELKNIKIIRDVKVSGEGTY